MDETIEVSSKVLKFFCTLVLPVGKGTEWNGISDLVVVATLVLSKSYYAIHDCGKQVLLRVEGPDLFTRTRINIHNFQTKDIETT